MNKIKLLVADDHTLFRKGLVNMLINHPNLAVVGEASDGTEVVEFVQSGANCNLILLDVNMPKMNGISTMVKLKSMGCKTPVLMLSMEDNENTIIRLINLGVKGYVLKDASYDQLVAAIQITATGNYFMNTVMSANLENAISLSNTEDEVLLTDREIEFLRFAATDLTYKEIAAEMQISVRTVDNYRETLFDRLKIKNRVSLVIWAIRNGIIQLT